MRHYPIACSILFVLAIAACSSSPKDSTELVVTVWSDLAVPTEIDAVRVRVSGLDQDMDQLFPLSADQRFGTYQIPLQVPVLPGNNTNRSIRVVAVASHQGAESVRQEAVLGFVFGQARELVLNLARSCENLLCTDAGFTCESGACARPLVVDPTTLPTYVPGQPSPVRGGAGGGATGGGGIAGTGGNTVLPPDAGWDPPPPTTVKVDQAVLSFGVVDVGTVSAPKTVTVIVTGSPIELNPTVTGAGFAISHTTCQARVQIGTCTVSVVFAPTSVGAASGTLDLGRAVVALSGVGTTPATFSLTPETIQLGTLAVAASVPVTVSIIPSGTLPSLACLPSGADLTLRTQTCPPAGSVSAQCTYTFTFKATTAGDKVEAIVCSGGGTTKTTTVTTNVVTVEPPVIVPSTYAFTATVGHFSTATFTMANYGGAPTGTLTAAVTGAGFSITQNDCVGTLPPLSTCRIQVTFAPSTFGSVTGALTVTDSTPGSIPGTAVFAGTGLSSQPAISPAAKDFATVTIGQLTSATFTMANTGNTATGIIALASTDAQFAIGSDLCSGHALDAKAQCSFGVTFAPTSVGLAQAMVTASETSDGAVLVFVTLTGTGKASSPGPDLGKNPPTLDFGTTTVGAAVAPSLLHDH
jgi:hypothetical protein